MLIVPDTHVFISGATLSQSYNGQIMQAWRDRTIKIATSEPILREIRRVLLYPHISKRYRWNSDQVDTFLKKIRKGAKLAEGKTHLSSVSADPNDTMFFECAVETGAEYIVSKDHHILDVGMYQGIQTVKPGYFVEQILKQQKAG